MDLFHTGLVVETLTVLFDLVWSGFAGGRGLNAHTGRVVWNCGDHACGAQAWVPVSVSAKVAHLGTVYIIITVRYNKYRIELLGFIMISYEYPSGYL